jgi:hypothetical protein
LSEDTGGHLQQICLPGRDLGFRTRTKFTPDFTFLTDTSIVCASDAFERLGLKLHGGEKKKKEQKLDYDHVGCFEFPQVLVSCDIILLQGELEVSELHLDEDTFMMYGHEGG